MRKIKNIQVKGLLLTLALMLGLTVFALPSQANYPEISVSVNGRLTGFTPPPQVCGVYITVSARGVAESMGSAVYWNQSTQTMTMVRGEQNATVENGNYYAVCSGSVVKLTVAPYFYDSRLYVPLTLFQQAFGAGVTWDGVDHIVRISTPDQSYQQGTGARTITVPDFSTLTENLQGYLATRPGQWSVYVQDLSSGQTLDIGAGKVYEAASTIKMPLILYLYELAAQGKVDLNTKLTYTSQYYEQGSGILQAQPFGGQYSLRELSRLAIENSDNVARNMIEGYLGYGNFSAFMSSLGGEATGTAANGNSLSTPRDMGKYLGALLVFRDEHPDLGNEILYYMEHSVYDPSGLPQELPSGTVVAHKMGAMDDKWHDVGIVFAPDHPYIITVFSQNGWEDASLQTIADVSRMVYNYETSLPAN